MTRLSSAFDKCVEDRGGGGGGRIAGGDEGDERGALLRAGAVKGG